MKLRRPFLVINPKAYLFDEALVDLAKYADQLAGEYDIDVLFTAQHVDLRLLKENTKHLIITAQHLDGILPGKGMGHILPEALKAAGVKAVFLNHAEHSQSLHELAAAISRAKANDIWTIVCADSAEEAKALAVLKPEVMVCEQSALIGTGIVADEDYMKATNDAVRQISPDTLVLQAAGISSGDDVYRAIQSGADGSGGTSGIVGAKDPKAVVRDMILALVKCKEEGL